MKLFRAFGRRRFDVPVGRFDVTSDRWRNLDDGGSATRERLTVATFNIWFNELHREQRYRAIAEVLSREVPDVMVFQEVTGAALDVFLSQAWIRQDYRRAAVVGTRGNVGNYGMLMLSRLPLRRCTYTRLPSRLSRGFLAGEVIVNGHDLAIVSVHLESGKAARSLRSRQIAVITEAFARHANVILLGDFNMRNSENGVLDPRYRDVWPQLHPDEPGFTEDTSINLMRYDMKDKHRQVRFDRVLVTGSAFEPTDVTLLGREPIAETLPRIFPSDHFGVLCRLNVAPPAEQDISAQNSR